MGTAGGVGLGIVLPGFTVASTTPVKGEHMAIASGQSPYTRAIDIAVGNSTGPESPQT